MFNGAARNDHGMVTMVMVEMTTYTATRLKAELLGVLDEVAQSGTPVTVTKHGRPIVRIVPFDDGATLSGSVTFHVSDDELVAPLGEVWGAESGAS